MHAISRKEKQANKTRQKDKFTHAIPRTRKTKNKTKSQIYTRNLRYKKNKRLQTREDTLNIMHAISRTRKKKTKQNLKISPTHILIQDTTCTSIRPTGPATSIRQSPLEVCVSSSSDERREEVKPGEEEP